MREAFGAVRSAALLLAAERLSLRTRRRYARSGEELLIIEADHLWAAPGLQIALEISGQIDGANGIAGADSPRRRREVVRALDDAEPGRRRHFFCEGP